MARFVYFDTDAFRHIVKAFALDQVSVELRDKIVLSPITILETLSQLTLVGQAGDEIRVIVRSLPNCVDRRRVPMLPWWTAVACGQVEDADDSLAKDIQAILNTCLNANSTAELQCGASALKDLLDIEREKQRRTFETLVEEYKSAPSDRAKFKDACALAIADRTKLESNNGGLAKVLGDLSAHLEYQEERVKLAAENPEHKPDKNDYLDSLQLIYLEDPQMHFLTCDAGYKKRIKCSSQLSRIHTVSVAELSDSMQAQAVLTKIVFR